MPLEFPPGDMGISPELNGAALFREFRLKSLTLHNRIVMAPMGMAHAVDGVPHPQYPEHLRPFTAELMMNLT